MSRSVDAEKLGARETKGRVLRLLTYLGRYLTVLGQFVFEPRCRLKGATLQGTLDIESVVDFVHYVSVFAK